MSTYHATFKCRACGAIRKDGQGSVLTALETPNGAFRAGMEADSYKNATRPHTCANGDIGIMDFICLSLET